MRKTTNKQICFFAITIVSLVSLTGRCEAGPKDRLYELYNSTSTPEHYKHSLEPVIRRREKLAAVIVRRQGFKLGRVYAHPNPAIDFKHPVIHVEAGIADSVEIKVYAPDGALAEKAVITCPPKIIKGVYAYEYKFASDNTPYGTCAYTVRAYKNGYPPLEVEGKLTFVKWGH